MPLSQKAKFGVQLLLGSLGQIFFYHLGIFLFFFFALGIRNSFVQAPLYFAFFLIPLQATYLRQGRTAFGYAAVASFALLVLMRLLMARALLATLATGEVMFSFESVRSLIYPFVALELITLGCLIAGLAAVNLYTGKRVLYRLLGATLASGVVGIVVTLVLSRSGGLLSALELFLKEAYGAMAGVLGSQSGETVQMPAELSSPGVLFKGMWHYALTGFVFGYFLNLSAAWYGGRAAANRSLGKRDHLEILARFRLPVFFVWPLIVSWALVLLTRLLKVNYIDSLVLNIALIFLFLYGMQGTSIARHLIMKYNVSRGWRLAVLVGLAAALFVPVLTLIVFIAVPALGVSEIWLKYRTRRKEQDEQ